MSPRKSPVLPDPQAIGRRVREIRSSERQWSFAHLLGVTQQAISLIERGDILPSVDTLLKLKQYSGKSIDWILTGDIRSE
jgi:DNA-binding XRE family transcriptional regulator